MGHNGGHSSEIIVNLDQWFRRCPLSKVVVKWKFTYAGKVSMSKVKVTMTTTSSELQCCLHLCCHSKSMKNVMG